MSRWGHIKPSLRAAKWSRIEPSHRGQIRLSRPDDRATDLLTLLVDVDNLKTVNDTHGHQAGDAVLTAIAITLRDHSRPGDVVVRWGGDEFLILAPGVSAENGLSFAERLVQAVRATHPAAPWNGLSLSVSVGVCPTHRTTIPIGRLDEALYAVKQAGKGHAALAPPSVEEKAIGEERLGVVTDRTSVEAAPAAAGGQ